jgi:hypothetical protein
MSMRPTLPKAFPTPNIIEVADKLEDFTTISICTTEKYGNFDGYAEVKFEALLGAIEEISSHGHQQSLNSEIEPDAGLMCCDRAKAPIPP